MRTKEFLSTRGVEFDSVNIKEQLERFERTAARFGIKALPLVVKGERCVNGQYMAEVAKLVGIDFDDGPRLSATELVRRTDSFMAAAQRYLAQLPDTKFRASLLPYRDNEYRELGHHIFNISEAFVELATGRGGSAAPKFDAPLGDSLDGFAALIGYGEDRRARLKEWWSMPERAKEDAMFDAPSGRRSLHQILERTCWHIGQHVRQLEFLLKENGVVPDGPLTDAMMAKLPFPNNVWTE